MGNNKTSYDEFSVVKIMDDSDLRKVNRDIRGLKHIIEFSQKQLARYEKLRELYLERKKTTKK